VPDVAADPLQHALAAVVGQAQVLADDDARAGYEVDWTGRFRGRARLVVRPGSVDEVAAVVRECATHGAAIVPQGGNTGLVGAGVPRADEVVLSLRRLDALGAVDSATLQVDAGAGVTLAALQARAAAAGLEAGVDFGARDTATLGGLVATNAGGIYALRHGTVRARVAGLQAVLADGSVLDRRGGLLKDNAGYDLPAVLVGSEGTLAVITAVRWRLVPRLPARVAVLVPLGSLAEAVDLLGALRPALPSLAAAEFLLDDALGLALEHLRVPPPIEPRAAAYALLECAAATDPTDELAAALARAGVDDAVAADDTAGRERLWRLRERLPEAIAAVGVPHKLDVGVPLDRLAAFADAVPNTVAAAAPGARAILFGHLGDGNVHVNVLGAPPDDTAVDEAVLRLCAAHGGTISAEHGVGVAKARLLGLVRSDAELRAMRALKRAWDPDGLLNPGAVLPPAAS
jgi:FAD/FMN-containing dehydrogenase